MGREDDSGQAAGACEAACLSEALAQLGFRVDEVADCFRRKKMKIPFAALVGHPDGVVLEMAGRPGGDALEGS